MDEVFVLVGSTNPAKISAVQYAFNKFFPEIKVIGEDIDSAIDRAVFEKVMQGAENRISNLKIVAKAKKM